LRGAGERRASSAARFAIFSVLESCVRIVELTTFQVRIPLQKPIRHASHTRSSTDNLVVRCTLEDGTEGFGEGVPRDYVTGETIDTSMSLLQSTDIRSQLRDCRDFPEAVALVENLRLDAVPGDDRACQGNAARCALELAILDAYGRHFGKTISTVTELVAPALYQPRDWVRYSGAITSANGFKVFIAAWRMRVWRFPHVKLKVGIDGFDDVKRLKELRRWLFRRQTVRLDANEAWPAREAADRIREMEPFGISAVEQPVSHAEVGALAEIRKQIRTPIMLDESLCSEIDARRAISDGTCDLFNLRLSKCGGFIPTLRLARLACKHGIGCQLGCQIGETALLSAAGRHFAASVADLLYVEGSYDRYLVREALGTEDLTFRWGGWAPALREPGLGVRIDPNALTRVTIRKEPILA
jgi:muconate cycloisomerase